jgi:L-threonylcarbamoyladenylate synthase
VCFPTESSYGLAVDPRNASALTRLATLKGRAATAPFALIAGNMQQARACTSAWPAQAEALAAKHWPGALTLILPPAAEIGPACIGPSGGVGLRISSLPAAQNLALGLGYAITATSANPSGAPGAETCAAAQTYFGAGVDAYIDGGRCNGQPSTLVDFGKDGQTQVLREGPIVLLRPDRP